MTNNYHTPIVSGAPANAAVINNPLSELDQALTEALFTERDGHIIQNEGIDLAQQPRLDFVGGGVSVANATGKTVVTIPQSITTLIVDGTTYARTLAGIQAAIDAASSDYTVYVTAGNYTINSSSGISISGKTNLKLMFDKGAVLTGTSAVTSGMLTIQSSNYVEVDGGVFDGDGAAVTCIKINNSGTALVSHIKINNTECKNNTTGSAISVSHPGTNFWYLEDISITNNYIHDCGRTGVEVKTTTRVVIKGNVIKNTGSTYHGIRCIGVINGLITENVITGFSGAGCAGIQSYMAVDTICSNNILDGSINHTASTVHGIYFDSAKGAVISNNTVRNGGSGIRLEVSSDSIVNGNTIESTGNVGIESQGRAGGTGGAGDDRVQENSLDSTTDITADANVTISTDTGDKMEGTGSLKAIVGAAFATGTLFYNDFASLRNWDTLPYAYLWVKSDIAVNAGVLQFKVSANTGLSSPHTSIDIPYLVAGQWTRFTLFSNKGYVANDYSARSWGIVAVSDPGTPTLRFDDLRMGTKTNNNTISNNVIDKPYAEGITISCLQAAAVADIALDNYMISNNLIRDAGWGANYAVTAKGIFLNSGSAFSTLKGISIKNNIISYVGAGGASNDVGISIRTVGTGAYIDELIIVDNNLSNTNTPISTTSVTNPLTNYTNAGNLLYRGAGNFYSGVAHTVISRYLSVGNVGTGVDDLYSDTLAASTFYAAGQSIKITYTGTFIGHATATRQLIASFGGITIFDSTALAITATTQWYLDVTITPSSIAGGTAVSIAVFRYSTLARTPTFTSLTGLTFTNAQILKITGESAGVGGGVNNDVTAQMAQGVWYP